MKSFIPGISSPGICESVSMLSLVAPGKKAQFTWLFSLAAACFSRSVLTVVVCGFVLGMSKYEVTPPKAAALLSDSMSALWVSPGSRKCTCVSMIPGRMKHPSASMTSCSPKESAQKPSLVLPSFTSAILPSLTIREPTNCRPSLIIVPFFIIIVVMINVFLLYFKQFVPFLIIPD